MSDTAACKQPTIVTSIWGRTIAALILAVVVVYAGLFWFLRNPSVLSHAQSEIRSPLANAARLETTVRALASIKPSRSMRNAAALVMAAGFVEAEFAKSGCRIELHPFQLRGSVYHNITCSFGPEDAERIILGAHYDVYSRAAADQAGVESAAVNAILGADDNASGVAGILEIARMIAEHKPVLDHRLDLVAFTLEEFVEPIGNDVLASIGSHRYVQMLKKEVSPVRLMVSVEMIGYFNDAPGSQRYPQPLSGLLSLFYPTTGNFIGVIGQAMDRSAVSEVRDLMAARNSLPVYSINAPSFVPGVDRSDHKNFWHAGFPAVMVTDTAEFRNTNYHTPGDTPDTLDYDRMARVVTGLYRVGVLY